MKKALFLISAFTFLFFSCSKDDDSNDSKKTEEEIVAKSVEKTNTDTKVWIHFMLWYETPEHEGHTWGQHWKKGATAPHFDESKGTWVDIYTRFPPLTGPYYSADPDILEYQLLLMKYSGIDGVIPDWYGVSDMGTKEDKTANMAALWEMTKKTKLEMAVCYEDRMKSSTKDVALASVVSDLKYLKTNYFGSSSYSKIDNKPLLLIFGPIKQTGATFWEDAFDTALGEVPAFFTLYSHSISFPSRGLSYGQFNWPNNCNYKSQYSSMMSNKQKEFIAGMWPGFKDCYNGTDDDDEPQYAVTEHRDGQELQEQIDYALTQKPKYLQIATWNDYGEGTMIEPTYKFGYTFLEKIQKFTGVKYTVEDLKNIKRLYDLRKQYAGNSETQKKLDKAFKYFNALEVEKAVTVMDEIGQ